MSAHKLSRKADESCLGAPSGRRATRFHPGTGAGKRRPFDRSRNAEKRGTEMEQRSALIDRMARRRRASWKLERRNPHPGRPYGAPT